MENSNLIHPRQQKDHPDYDRIRADIDAAAVLDEAFFAYRLPDSDTIVTVRNAVVSEGIFIQDSFVVYSFDGSFYASMTADQRSESTEFNNNINKTESGSPVLSIPESTSESVHGRNVKTIVNELNRIGYGKCVLSRIIVGDCLRSPGENFVRLCRSSKTTFVFCYNTARTGLWIGASPETLLSASGGKLHTMALAGTRQADSSGPWDKKNIEEQQIVTRFIADALSQNGLSPIISPLFTRKAGPVEHLCQLIESHFPDCDSQPSGGFSEIAATERVIRLLNILSPTPALGGYPKDTALRLISELEEHDRNCYGGFCGPFYSAFRFDLFVNLRSARLYPMSTVNSTPSYRYVKYVGGGITRMSDSAEEWNETELKAQSFDL